METRLERRDLDMQLRKNKRYTILVSGASGIVGYGILRCLRNRGHRLIGTTIYEESPANCFSDIVEKPPLTTNEKYIPWLIQTIQKYGVDMIIPAIEADMKSWNENRYFLERTGTVVMLNQSSLIELCLDKWKFYEKMIKNHCPYTIPTVLDINDINFNLPFILKPRCGFGSREIVLIENKEFVGNSEEEYTISAFCDKNSIIRACIGMKRRLAEQGYTEIAQVVNVEEIKYLLEDLICFLKPVGPTNFQFRKCNDEWKLLEVNPRISSSTSIRCAFGYNEAQMCVDYFLEGKEVVQPQIKYGKAIRYTEDYITYDSNNI